MLLVTDSPTLEIGLGANAWNRVGLTAGFENDPSTPDCGGAVWDGCELAIRVDLVPGLSRINGPDGYAVGRAFPDELRLEMDADVTGRRAAHVIAHELGHVVFDCRHLAVEDVRFAPTGIMASTATAPYIIEPSAADYHLACRSAGYCLD